MFNVSDKQEQNKINTFIFYAETQPILGEANNSAS
jgi:hypothetical protein